MKPVRSLFCLIALLPAVAAAQSDRLTDWEAGFHIADYSSLSLIGFGGATVQAEAEIGYGFSGAYNFTDHIGVGLDVSWRSPDYRATFVPDGAGPVRTIDATMDIARVHLKGIYYFLDTHVRPFIEGGYGWTRIDSNILDGPPITGCWYDPFWGYTCRTTYTTYAETKTSYGAAVGVRWDSDFGISLRGSLGALNIHRGEGVGDSSTDTAQFEVIWRF